MIDEQRYRSLIQQLATGGITGNNNYNQISQPSQPMSYMNGGGIGSMMQPRMNFAGGGGDFAIQGGVENYKPSEMVTTPIEAKSSPNHPSTELAYITQAEKDLLIKKDLHNSLKGKPNKGPSGLMSLNGGFNEPGGFQGGGNQSAAESGDKGAFGGGAENRQRAMDVRSAAINAGAGQRVNPGFFDSRTFLSPEETARAKSYREDPSNPFANKSYNNTGQSGFMNFITSGGIMGNLIRNLGQRFGLGKGYDDTSTSISGDFNNNLGLDGINPATLDFDPNAKIQDTSFIKNNPNIIGIENDPIFTNAMAKLNKTEQRNYDNLTKGKELNMNTPEMNKQLEQLEQKKNEASLNTTTAIV